MMATQPEDLREQLEQSLEQEDEQPDDHGIDSHDEGQADDQQDEGDEQDVITFGDTEATTEEEPEGMRNLRNRLKEIERENRALKGVKTEQHIGPRPALEAFDYDEDAHAEALAKWLEAKNEAKRRETEEEERARKLQERFDGQRRDFEQGFSRLAIVGKDAARGRAEDRLTEAQQMMIVKAGRDKAPALMVLLGSDSAKLDALLAHADDPADFLVEATLLAKEINVQKRKPATVPEERHGGSPGGGGAKGDQRLARLEAEADKTGDRTKLLAYRREMREKA